MTLDLDATFGLFFDGFSKILSATGIMVFVFGMPAELVIGKMVPAIAIATFIGNMWYAFEAFRLAGKEKRSDVTAQPFGIGASQVAGWLFLIMGPVYWETGNADLAFRVGVAGAFIGGIIEIAGAFLGRVFTRWIPQSALLGNLASGAFIWLAVVGVVTVFDKPEVAVLPLFIILLGYLGKCNRSFKNIPVGFVAIIVGTALAWGTGMMTPEGVKESFTNMGFYLPDFFLPEILSGMGEVVPYLPIIIPLQIGNFLTTLQGVEAARISGDVYPEKESMLADGITTVVGALLGNPFPTTVYYGHAGWKKIEAHAGFSIANGIIYLLIGISGLTGVIMSIVPYEVAVVLLVYVGISVSASTYTDIPAQYHSVILLSLIPIIAQYAYNLISSAVQAAGTTIGEISMEKFAEFSVPVKGLTILSNGAFLTSLFLAAVLAYVIDQRYKSAAAFCLILSAATFIGLIHHDVIQLFPKDTIVIGVVYAIAAVLLLMMHGKIIGVGKSNDNNKKENKGGSYDKC